LQINLHQIYFRCYPRHADRTQGSFSNNSSFSFWRQTPVFQRPIAQKFSENCSYPGLAYGGEVRMSWLVPTPWSLNRLVGAQHAARVSFCFCVKCSASVQDEILMLLSNLDRFSFAEALPELRFQGNFTSALNPVHDIFWEKYLTPEKSLRPSSSGLTTATDSFASSSISPNYEICENYSQT